MLRYKVCGSANLSNLKSIPCEPQPIIGSLKDNTPKTVNLCLLNIRSLAGKSFLINDFITENKLDFLFLTETWLAQNSSAAVLIDYMSETRAHKKGGGVAIVLNGSLQCKQLSFGNFASFEYVAFLLKSSSRVIFINVYRPPKFSDDFTELLSTICMDHRCRLRGGHLLLVILTSMSITLRTEAPNNYVMSLIILG
ncbi:hypothetical protein N1851_018739 [Merluccius polli]|uniref:Uncharacterized protein n=1 Tax=Merluccius polli TaxID=89951 RepID=A0AA47MN85_MERPO|nr:hypothetical protein N1851_018739 [Merluccius polli]